MEINHPKFKLIEELADEESANTVTWSIFSDADGKIWIDGKSRCCKEAGGTFHVWIKRSGNTFRVNQHSLRERKISSSKSFVSEPDPKHRFPVELY